jgi:hypothetical protein
VSPGAAAQWEELDLHAERMRAAGIEEIEFDVIGSAGAGIPGGEQIENLERTKRLYIRRIRLSPSGPVVKPEAPILDADPLANSAATKAWIDKEVLKRRDEQRLEDERVRFAHTEGT